ncbi:tudor domain-containing 5 isoform X1 [Pelobates cultripes]|uniref:Tudor domain-containing protein 5 n=1 Tax=Pelobates cultripes TaxID=61616 RepID=A0AAD1WHH4_PELCU|nr:tudor domain-containing 5 isoform X1 [Pelobates cultripes]
MDDEKNLDTAQKDIRALLIASKNGLSIQELEHDYRMMIGSHIPLRTLGYRSTMEMVLDMPNVVHVQSRCDGTVLLSGLTPLFFHCLWSSIASMRYCVCTCSRRNVESSRSRAMSAAIFRRNSSKRAFRVPSVTGVPDFRSDCIAPCLPLVCTSSSIKSAVVDESTKSIADLVSRQKNPSKSKPRKRRVLRPRYHVDITRRGRIAPVLPATVKSDLRDLLSISPLLVSELEKAFASRFGRSFQYSRYGFYSMLEVIRSISDIVQVKQTRAGSLLVLRTPEDSETAGTEFQIKLNHKASTKLAESPNSSEVSCKKKPVENTNSLYVSTSQEEHQVAEGSRRPESHAALNSPSSPARSPDPITNSSIRKNHLLEEIKTPESQGSMKEKDHVSPLAPAKDDSLQWLETKLEKELRLCLAQKGAGGNISPDLRLEIQHIVKQHPEGLLVSQLPVVFKNCLGKDLPYRHLGFMSVMELIGSLGDMLHLERTKDGKDWYLFDLETTGRNSDDDPMMLASTRSLSNWDLPQPKNIVFRPINSLNTFSLLIIMSSLSFKWGPLELQLPLNKENEIPPDAVRQQKLHSLSRMKRGFMIGVLVENITSPSEFYIRCYGKDTSEKLEDMMIEMRRCYSNECVSERYAVPDNCISVGEIYAVKVTGDVWWYRVIVHAIVNDEEVTVYYPDFGTVSTVKRCLLRFLKNCYMRLPAQAVPSCLAFVRPVEDFWSTKAIKRFQQLCGCGPLVGLVLQYVMDVLYLFLCDTSSDEDVYLHQVLTSNGLGHVGQEPGFYKNVQKCNPYMHHLKHSPVKAPEVCLEECSKSSMENKCVPSENISDYEPIHEIDVKFEMPYLEALPTGGDIWDENWSLSECKYDLVSPIPTLDSSQNKPSKLSAESDDGTQMQDPLEEFYISLIQSRKSQDNNVEQQSSARDLPELEIVSLSNIEHDPGSQLSNTSVDEKLCEKNDVLLCEEPTYYQQASINPFVGLQKLHMSRNTMVALGPAARLATSGRFMNWATDQ